MGTGALDTVGGDGSYADRSCLKMPGTEVRQSRMVVAAVARFRDPFRHIKKASTHKLPDLAIQFTPDGSTLKMPGSELVH